MLCNAGEGIAALRDAVAGRVVAQTQANEASSRSHVFLKVIELIYNIYNMNI